MVAERLVWGIGWLSLAMGFTLLAPARASRLFGLGGRPWLMRAIGARDLAIGLGLLGGQRRARWLRLHALADAADAILVAANLRSGAMGHRGRAWLVVALASGAFSLIQARRSPDRV